MEVKVAEYTFFPAWSWSWVFTQIMCFDRMPRGAGLAIGGNMEELTYTPVY